MGKGRKEGGRVERLRALYGAGDHGAARRLSVEVLRDPAAGGDERDEALAVRARTAPDRGVVIAGIAGAVVAVVVSAWLLSR